MFEEYDEVRQPGFLIFAVNDVGCYLAHVDHWVSLHTPRLDHWVEVRRDPTSRPMGNLDFHVHDAGLYGARTWYQWTGLTPLMALSGMFAAQVAYLMGCCRSCFVDALTTQRRGSLSSPAPITPMSRRRNKSDRRWNISLGFKRGDSFHVGLD